MCACLFTVGGGGSFSCHHYPWCIGPSLYREPQPHPSLRTWDVTVQPHSQYWRHVHTCYLKTPQWFWHLVAVVRKRALHMPQEYFLVTFSCCMVQKNHRNIVTETQTDTNPALLPPTKRSYRKVIFSQECVCPQGVSIPGPRSFPGGGMSKHSGRWVPEGEYSPTNTTPTWDLLGVGTHPPLLTPSGSHQNMYGWQTIGLLVFFSYYS